MRIRPMADVPNDGSNADDRTRFVTDRREADRELKEPPMGRRAGRFERGHVLATPGSHARFPDPAALGGGMHLGDRPADYVLGLDVVEALGRGIEAEDDAVQRLGHDYVMG